MNNLRAINAANVVKPRFNSSIGGYGICYYSDDMESYRQAEGNLIYPSHYSETMKTVHYPWFDEEGVSDRRVMWREISKFT